MERKGKFDQSKVIINYKSSGGLCLRLGSDSAVCLYQGFLNWAQFLSGSVNTETVYNNIMCMCLFHVTESMNFIRFSKRVWAPKWLRTKDLEEK